MIYKILLFLLLPLTLQAQFIPDSIDFNLDHDSSGTRIEMRVWSGDWQFIIQDTVQFSPRFSYRKFTDDLIYERSLTKLDEDERNLGGYPPRSYALRIEHTADSLKLRYAGKEMTSNFGIFMDTLQVKSDRLVIESKAYLSNLIQEKTFVMAVNGANYFEVTVDATQVPSDLTNPVLFVDFADLGGAHGFWSNVAADGSDIRVTRDDGTTELPFDVRAIDTGANTGHMFFRDDSTLSSSTNTTFRVYYNSSDSAYADTDPFGRNNVYQDYLTVLPLSESGNGTAGEFDDVTGNNTTGTGGGGSGTATPSQTSADMPFSGGSWNLFDGSDDYIEIDNSVNAYEGTNLTIQAIFKPEGDGTDESGIINKRLQGNDSGGLWQLNYNDDAGADNRNLLTTFNDGTNEDEIIGTTEVDTGTGSTFWIAATWSSSLIQILVNGAVDVEDTTPTIDPTTWGGNTSEATIGAYFDLSSARCTNAKMAEVRIRGEQLSQDWLQTEYNNQANSATFYTLSAEQNVTTTLTGDGVSHNHTLDASTLQTIELPGDDLAHTHSLESSTLQAINLSGQGLQHSHTVDASSLQTIDLSGNDLQHSNTLDQATLQAIQLIGQDLSHSHTLDQATVIAGGVLNAEDIVHGHNLDQATLQVTLSGADIQQGHNLETGTLIITLDGVDLSHSQTLDPSTIQTIGISGDDLAHSHNLQAGSLIIVGGATQVEISAEKQYTISLEAAKLYQVTLSDNKLYSITLNANEIID